MSAATGWTFIACPTGIAAEWQAIRQVMLLWRILPGTELPSFALSRLVARNGSCGRFWRQKVLRPARGPLLR